MPYNLELLNSSNPTLNDVNPDLVDINGDNVLDLLLGDLKGNIYYLENFGNSTLVKNPFGIDDVGGTASPEFIDIDNDGDLDFFSGNRKGNTIYKENIGTSTNPDFSGSELSNPFGISDVGRNANLTFADIDHDFDYDLFIGNRGGVVRFYENVGTSTTPKYQRHKDRTPFDISIEGKFASPEFIDFDLDGDLDLYVGYAQSSRLFKNIGTKYKPLFQAEGSIVDESLLDENVNQIKEYLMTSNTSYELANSSSFLQYALQFSSGGYLDENSPAIDDFEPTHFAIGDLDDDGAQDILMSTGSGDLIFQPSAVQPQVKASLI